MGGSEGDISGGPAGSAVINVEDDEQRSTSTSSSQH